MAPASDVQSTAQPERRHSQVQTCIGELTVVAQDDALAAIYFPDHWHLPAGTDHGPRVDPAGDPVLARAVAQLTEYLAGERREFDLPLAPAGDEFSQRVWNRLQRIGFGERLTYGEIAEELGNIGLARRVGQSVGRNPLSIVIPCHRVVGKDGSLTGYAGGLDRKRFLLELETAPAPDAGRLF